MKLKKRKYNIQTNGRGNDKKTVDNYLGTKQEFKGEPRYITCFLSDRTDLSNETYMIVKNWRHENKAWTIKRLYGTPATGFRFPRSYGLGETF